MAIAKIFKQKSPYPYIIAYGRLMGSQHWYVEQEVQKAIERKLPIDTWAVRGENEKPFTINDTENKTLKSDLDNILKDMGYQIPELNRNDK